MKVWSHMASFMACATAMYSASVVNNMTVGHDSGLLLGAPHNHSSHKEGIAKYGVPVQL